MILRAARKRNSPRPTRDAPRAQMSQTDGFVAMHEVDWPTARKRDLGNGVARSSVTVAFEAITNRDNHCRGTSTVERGVVGIVASIEIALVYI